MFLSYRVKFHKSILKAANTVHIKWNVDRLLKDNDWHDTDRVRLISPWELKVREVQKGEGSQVVNVQIDQEIISCGELSVPSKIGEGRVSLKPAFPDLWIRWVICIWTQNYICKVVINDFRKSSEIPFLKNKSKSVIFTTLTKCGQFNQISNTEYLWRCMVDNFQLLDIRWFRQWVHLILSQI